MNFSFLFGFNYLISSSNSSQSFFGQSLGSGNNFVNTGLKHTALNDHGTDRLFWYFLTNQTVGSFYTRTQGYLRLSLSAKTRRWFRARYSNAIIRSVPNFLFSASDFSTWISTKKRSRIQFPNKLRFKKRATFIMRFLRKQKVKKPWTFIKRSYFYLGEGRSFYYINRRRWLKNKFFKTRRRNLNFFYRRLSFLSLIFFCGLDQFTPLSVSSWLTLNKFSTNFFSSITDSYVPFLTNSLVSSSLPVLFHSKPRFKYQITKTKELLKRSVKRLYGRFGHPTLFLKNSTLPFVIRRRKWVYRRLFTKFLLKNLKLNTLFKFLSFYQPSCYNKRSFLSSKSFFLKLFEFKRHVYQLKSKKRNVLQNNAYFRKFRFLRNAKLNFRLVNASFLLDRLFANTKSQEAPSFFFQKHFSNFWISYPLSFSNSYSENISEFGETISSLLPTQINLSEEYIKKFDVKNTFVLQSLKRKLLRIKARNNSNYFRYLANLKRRFYQNLSNTSELNSKYRKNDFSVSKVKKFRFRYKFYNNLSKTSLDKKLRFVSPFSASVLRFSTPNSSFYSLIKTAFNGLDNSIALNFFKKPFFKSSGVRIPLITGLTSRSSFKKRRLFGRFLNKLLVGSFFSPKVLLLNSSSLKSLSSRLLRSNFLLLKNLKNKYKYYNTTLKLKKLFFRVGSLRNYLKFKNRSKFIFSLLWLKYLTKNSSSFLLLNYHKIRKYTAVRFKVNQLFRYWFKKVRLGSNSRFLKTIKNSSFRKNFKTFIRQINLGILKRKPGVKRRSTYSEYINLLLKNNPQYQKFVSTKQYAFKKTKQLKLRLRSSPRVRLTSFLRFFGLRAKTKVNFVNKVSPHLTRLIANNYVPKRPFVFSSRFSFSPLNRFRSSLLPKFNFLKLFVFSLIKGLGGIAISANQRNRKRVVNVLLKRIERFYKIRFTSNRKLSRFGRKLKNATRSLSTFKSFFSKRYVRKNTNIFLLRFLSSQVTNRFNSAFSPLSFKVFLKAKNQLSLTAPKSLSFLLARLAFIKKAIRETSSGGITNSLFAALENNGTVSRPPKLTFKNTLNYNFLGSSLYKSFVFNTLTPSSNPFTVFWSVKNLLSSIVSPSKAGSKFWFQKPVPKKQFFSNKFSNKKAYVEKQYRFYKTNFKYFFGKLDKLSSFFNNLKFKRNQILCPINFNFVKKYNVRLVPILGKATASVDKLKALFTTASSRFYSFASGLSANLHSNSRFDFIRLKFKQFVILFFLKLFESLKKTAYSSYFTLSVLTKIVVSNFCFIRNYLIFKLLRLLLINASTVSSFTYKQHPTKLLFMDVSLLATTLSKASSHALTFYKLQSIEDGFEKRNFKLVPTVSGLNLLGL